MVAWKYQGEYGGPIASTRQSEVAAVMQDFSCSQKFLCFAQLVLQLAYEIIDSEVNIIVTAGPIAQAYY